MDPSQRALSFCLAGRRRFWGCVFLFLGFVGGRVMGLERKTSDTGIRSYHYHLETSVQGNVHDFGTALLANCSNREYWALCERRKTKKGEKVRCGREVRELHTFHAIKSRESVWFVGFGVCLTGKRSRDFTILCMMGFVWGDSGVGSTGHWGMGVRDSRLSILKCVEFRESHPHLVCLGLDYFRCFLFSVVSSQIWDL